MGNATMDDVAPGWIDVWRLWRHCLCRFGWYPLFVAPLVTCACLLDLYSSTGCDFIRLDIGFVPANDVWSDSQAELGLFSFDSHQTDRNKWKRSFNNGCQLYSESFEAHFISSDPTWHVSQIMAYISGIASLVALSTAWLLTITPLPASFLWPGVLLPAVVLSMLAGAAKFIFFDTQICTEPLWFVDESSQPAAARSCEIGESSVFGIASVAAYFFCTILICFRSPQKRKLDENFGKRPGGQGSTATANTIADVIVNDPERGQGDVKNAAVAISSSNNLGIEERESSATLMDSQQTSKINNIAPRIIEHGQHTRSTSDVTWSTDSNKNVPASSNTRSKNNVVVISPPTKEPPLHENQRPGPSNETEWNSYGRPIVVTLNDSGHATKSRSYSKDQSLSYSDGSTTQTSSKSPASRGTPGSGGGGSGGGGDLPPRHNAKSTVHRAASHGSRNDNDASSVSSRISKLSFTDTHVSEEISALGMQSYTGASRGPLGAPSNRSAPSVVAIPRRSRHHTISATAPTSVSSSHSSGKRLRYSKHGSKRGGTWEDRRDVFLNEQQHQSGRIDGSKRDGTLEYLPPLDEMSTTRSLDTRSVEDHGDLISKCVRELQMSFEDNGFRTL